ncbi:hypothetical protein CspHIS471_0104230 [Cutaneotrichosporon sp. HIS471]|nr:hypothetical protein CspHIS471_0104230 [Cutaneotrichosporon sp. HIS471]
MLGETIETLVRHREQVIGALSEYVVDLEEEGEQEESCIMAKGLLAVQKELLEGLLTGGINATPTEWHMEQIVSALTYHVDYDFNVATPIIVDNAGRPTEKRRPQAVPTVSEPCQTEVIGQAMALVIGLGAIKAMAAAAHKHSRDRQDSQAKRPLKVVLVDNETGSGHASQRAEFDTSVCLPGFAESKGFEVLTSGCPDDAKKIELIGAKVKETRLDAMKVLKAAKKAGALQQRTEMTESIASTDSDDFLAWHGEGHQTFLSHCEAVAFALDAYITDLAKDDSEIALGRATFAKGLLTTEQELIEVLGTDEGASPTAWNMRENLTALANHIFNLECLQARFESSNPDMRFERSEEYEDARRTLFNETVLLARFQRASVPDGSHDPTVQDLASVPLRGKPRVIPPRAVSHASDNAVFDKEKEVHPTQDSHTNRFGINTTAQTKALVQAVNLMGRAVEAMEAATSKRRREADDGENKAEYPSKVFLVDDGENEGGDDTKNNNGRDHRANMTKLVALQAISAAAHRSAAHTIALGAAKFQREWDDAVELEELKAIATSMKEARGAALEVYKAATNDKEA